MPNKTQFRQQTGVATAITIIITFLIITIGAFFIQQEGLVFDDIIFRAFIFYSISIIIFPIASLSDLIFDIKPVFFYLFRPQESIIYFLWLKNKSDPVLNFLWTTTKNFLLTFLLWQALFLVLAFISALFVPQSALPFFETYVFPVRPQSIFGLDIDKTFFTIVPSPAETGILIFILSITSSLFITTFDRITKKRTILSRILALFIFGILLSGFYWVNIHEFASQGRQFDRTGHYIFGAESGALTILTGQWTPALALHNANLIFWTLSDQVSSREFLRISIQVTTILLLIIIISITIIMNNKKLKKSFKKIFR